MASGRDCASLKFVVLYLSLSRGKGRRFLFARLPQAKRWRSLFQDKDGHQASREFRTKRKFNTDSVFIFNWRVDNAFPYDKRRLCKRDFVFYSGTYEHPLSCNGHNFVCLDIFSGTKKWKGNSYSRQTLFSNSI